mgnify:CR=1 FL=1
MRLESLLQLSLNDYKAPIRTAHTRMAFPKGESSQPGEVQVYMQALLVHQA